MLDLWMSISHTNLDSFAICQLWIPCGRVFDVEEQFFQKEFRWGIDYSLQSLTSTNRMLSILKRSLKF